MALDATLTRAGHPPASLDVTAKVHLTQSGGTFDIARIELFLSATIGGITDNEFQELAMHSKESCPIGRALHGVPTALIATLHTTV
jgi:osmotically inducible protein OsmC